MRSFVYTAQRPLLPQNPIARVVSRKHSLFVGHCSVAPHLSNGRLLATSHAEQWKGYGRQGYASDNGPWLSPVEVHEAPRLTGSNIDLQPNHLQHYTMQRIACATEELGPCSTVQQYKLLRMLNAVATRCRPSQQDWATTLRVEYTQTEPFQWTPHVWADAQMAVSHVETVADIPTLLKVGAQQRLVNDALLCRTLRQGGYCIQMHSTMQIPGCRWGEVSLLELGDLVETVADLFSDPMNDCLYLRIGVELSLEQHRGVPAAKLEELILTETATLPYRYFKIGNLPTPDDELREKLDRRTLKTLARDVEIRYVWALIAWYDDNKRLRLSRVHAYEFDDFCVGDRNSWTPWNRGRFNSRTDYAMPYMGLNWMPHNKADLEALVDEHAESGAPEPGSGVPYLPFYSFNTFRPNEYGLGTSTWPKEGIEVAIRCVNHHQSESAPRRLVSPPDIRLVVERGDTVQDIGELVCSEIDRAGYEHGVIVNSGLLFEPPCNGQWELDFWVMPQCPAPRKLFRYVDGDLMQFLTTSLKVRSKDKRLYMEAHIVSR